MSHEHTRQWGMWGFSRTESRCWSIVYDQQSKNVALGTWFINTVVTIMYFSILRIPSPPCYSVVSRKIFSFRRHLFPPHHCTTQHLCTFAIGLPAPAAIRKDRNTGLWSPMQTFGPMWSYITIFSSFSDFRMSSLAVWDMRILSHQAGHLVFMYCFPWLESSLYG